MHSKRGLIRREASGNGVWSPKVLVLIIIAIFNMNSLTSANVSYAPIQALKNGETILVTMTSTVGTLVSGYAYLLTYIPATKTFTLYGYNKRCDCVTSRGYNNGDIESNVVSLWGVLATYDGAGNLSSPSSSIATVTQWPFFKYLDQVQMQAGMFNTVASGSFYNNNFKDVLRTWITQTSATYVASNMATFLQAKYTAVLAGLRMQYPNLSEEHYKGLMIQNLAHGFYTYGAGPSLPTSLANLLSSPSGNCATFQELIRLMGTSWRLNLTNITITVDYLPAPAGGLVEYYGSDSNNGSHEPAVHAINLLTDTFGHAITLDGQTNISIALGMSTDGVIVGVSPIDRFASLRNAGRIYGFYNYYMQSNVHAYYVSNNLPDPTIMNFAYSYVLESYRAPLCGSPLCGSYPCVPSQSASNAWWLCSSAAALPQSCTRITGYQ